MKPLSVPVAQTFEGVTILCLVDKLSYLVIVGV